MTAFPVHFVIKIMRQRKSCIQVMPSLRLRGTQQEAIQKIFRILINMDCFVGVAASQ
jgi:hypothetical protein